MRISSSWSEPDDNADTSRRVGATVDGLRGTTVPEVEYPDSGDQVPGDNKLLPVYEGWADNRWLCTVGHGCVCGEDCQ